MIKIVFEKHFLKRVSKLPTGVQGKMSKLLLLLEEDPFHPTLRTKRLAGTLIGLLSFRVTRNHRVVFRFIDETTIQLLDAGDRKDIYR